MSMYNVFDGILIYTYKNLNIYHHVDEELETEIWDKLIFIGIVDGSNNFLG